MSKTIIIKTVGYMIEKMPDKKAKFEFSIGDNDSVRDCILALGLPVEDNYMVFADSKFVTLDYCPSENENIQILYAVTGG